MGVVVVVLKVMYVKSISVGVGVAGDEYVFGFF